MGYDIIIVGAGPAGIFTALELLRNEYKGKILIIEKGREIRKRHCPKETTGKCVNCKPYCHITTGFSGAGAFSDGKLSLSSEVGGDYQDLWGTFSPKMIEYTDKIYLEFGADTKIEGLGNEEKIKDIRRKAIQSGLKLVDCPIRHLGTEKAQVIYASIEDYLLEHGVEILFGHICENIILDEETCKGVIIEDVNKRGEKREVKGEHIIIATGRKGADWLEQVCEEHHIAHQPGTVDMEFG
jgi:uncharacterized FAD-dependent dehydrogenase